MTKHTYFLLLANLVAFAASPLPAFSQSSPGAAARPVVAAALRTETIAETAEVLGTAEANSFAEIRPDVSGRVTEILFAEGTLLKAGEALLKLDARAAEARRDQTKAEVENASHQLRRARALNEGTAVTSARLDELEAALDGAKARLREAEVLVDQHTVRMPFDGVVGLRRISVGAQISEDTVVTTADDSLRIRAVFRIPDVWLDKVAVGLQVKVAPAQQRDIYMPGMVTALDSRVDSGSRTIGVKAMVENPDGVIRPGGLLRVEVPMASRGAAIIAPEQAILTTGDQHAVFVVREGKAFRVPVKIGLRQRGLVEIVEGVKAGELVVAAGADRLRHEAAVEVAEMLPGWAPVEAPTAAEAQ